MVLVGFGLAFCVAVGRSAAVSLSLSAVLRPVLVSSPNEAAASFTPIVGSRLVLVLPFRVCLDFDRAAVLLPFSGTSYWSIRTKIKKIAL